MPLSDATIRILKATDKPYKVSDFDGLFLLSKVSGSKSWRFKYSLSGKEKLLVIGDYPGISLAQARLARDAARALVANKTDVLISIANSYALVGKCSIVEEVQHPATFGAFLAALRFEDLLPKYATNFLASEYSLAAFRIGSSQTTNIANITFSTIRGHLFPLPPVAEQHRIVAKVDELMALLDRLEQARAGREALRDQLTAATLNRLTQTEPQDFQPAAHFALQTLPHLTTRPDQIKTLRQTILNLAVRGKLVEQDAAEGSGHDLINLIAKVRNAEKKGGRGKPRRKRARFPQRNNTIPFQRLGLGRVSARLG